MKRISRITVVMLTLALAGALAATNSAGATVDRSPLAAEVTHGDFATLPGGQDLGYSVEGRAHMVRAGDRTIVVVHVRGLEANTTYPTHVHNAPCAATPAGGGHYQDQIGIGPSYVNAVNEIWPVVSTNPTGRGLGYATHAHRARAQAMSIVIHYPANTTIRLACVDLT